MKWAYTIKNKTKAALLFAIIIQALIFSSKTLMKTAGHDPSLN